MACVFVCIFRGCRREMDMDIGDLRCMDEALLILLIIIH